MQGRAGLRGPGAEPGWGQAAAASPKNPSGKRLPPGRARGLSRGCTRGLCWGPVLQSELGGVSLNTSRRYDGSAQWASAGGHGPRVTRFPLTRLPRTRLNGPGWCSEGAWPPLRGHAAQSDSGLKGASPRPQLFPASGEEPQAAVEGPLGAPAGSSHCGQSRGHPAADASNWEAPRRRGRWARSRVLTGIGRPHHPLPALWASGTESSPLPSQPPSAPGALRQKHALHAVGEALRRGFPSDLHAQTAGPSLGDTRAVRTLPSRGL